MSNNDTKFKLHCASCKPIFYLLASLGELPKEEIDKLENHKMVCPAGLEYSFRVSEIMSGLQYQPAETEINAMELLSTEVWHFKESKIVDRTLSELLENIEFKNKRQEITDLIKSIPDSQQVVKEMDTLGNKVRKLEATQTVIFKEIQSIKLTFLIVSLTVVSISILIFLILGLPVFHKQNVVFEKETEHTLSIIENNNKVNLYEALDISLSSYLSGQSSISEAENISKKIKTQNNDNYGMDLVRYYKGLPSEANPKLLKLREELFSLENNTFKEDPEVILNKVDYLRQEFFVFGNLIEAYRAKIVLIKYSVLTANTRNLTGLLSESESWVTNNNYLFLKLQILLWKSKDLREPNPQRAIENVVELASKLGITDIQISASISLAGIYVNKDDNEKALQLIEGISTLNPTKVTHKVTTLQIQGLAYFKLRKYEQSSKYFHDAINLSLDKDNKLLAALSYSFLATTLSQSGKYSECDKSLIETEKLVSDIKISHHKKEIIARIRGYQAKNEYLQGNYHRAIELYKESIELTESLEIDSSTELADLNKALSATLKQVNNKNYLQYEQIANYHSKKMYQQQDLMNCILSFSVACN